MSSKYENLKSEKLRKTRKNLDNDFFEGTSVDDSPYTEICEGSPFQLRSTAGDGFLNSLSVYFGYF